MTIPSKPLLLSSRRNRRNTARALLVCSSSCAWRCHLPTRRSAPTPWHEAAPEIAEVIVGGWAVSRFSRDRDLALPQSLFHGDCEPILK